MWDNLGLGEALKCQKMDQNSVKMFENFLELKCIVT